MITIENTVNASDEQWRSVIMGARNPMNSWSRSDTKYHPLVIGKNDHNLWMSLSESGPDHAKFLRMIPVYADITAPLYWWKEYDTYKVGTVANSCSTMHKITSKEFEVSDFSTDRLSAAGVDVLKQTIWRLNAKRDSYNINKSKDDWYELIQLLPSSYNQRRTVMANYQVLKAMYFSRRSHKLDEWHVFCEWLKTLPHSEFITREECDS